VSGLGELSIHLTFAFEPLAGIRQRRIEAGALLNEEVRELSVDNLKQHLALLTDRRPGGSFPSALTDTPGEHAKIRWASRFPPIIVSRESNIVVRSRGKIFMFDERAYLAIQALATGREYRWHDLLERSRMTRAQLEQFVRFCIHQEILICQG
jgi:hypothetical protein